MILDEELTLVESAKKTALPLPKIIVPADAPPGIRESSIVSCSEPVYIARLPPPPSPLLCPPFRPPMFNFPSSVPFGLPHSSLSSVVSMQTHNPCFSKSSSNQNLFIPPPPPPSSFGNYRFSI